jgi:hypothetical protein
MRILSVLTCCFGLALFANAAQQQDDQTTPQGKKKGSGNAPVQQQQVAAPQTGKKFKAGPGGGPHNDIKIGNRSNFKQQGTANYTATNATTKKGKWQGPVTGGNSTNLPAVQSTGKNTTFNKTVNKNITVNKNFKVQKFNLSNKVNTSKYQAVKFSGNYKIAGAQNWKGAKYQVFVNYQPQWHDQWWWSSHHNHIVFVFGAPYYWDTGYWYPAWGYDPGASYYYDGPIYASNPEMDPGQTVANVQSALQQQGYYQGEIDGILGPQTRAALAEYQSAQGLEPTGAVDEPTLETLGMV